MKIYIVTIKKTEAMNGGSRPDFFLLLNVMIKILFSRRQQKPGLCFHSQNRNASTTFILLFISSISSIFVFQICFQ